MKWKEVCQWTTKGWFLCVHWKDTSTSSERLADLKDSYLLIVAEYAEANQLIREPTFTWWAPAALRKRKHIIKQLKMRYPRHTEKFGLELPKNSKESTGN